MIVRLVFSIRDLSGVAGGVPASSSQRRVRRPSARGGRLGKIEVLLASVRFDRKMRWFAFTEADHFLLPGVLLCSSTFIPISSLLPSVNDGSDIADLTPGLTLCMRILALTWLLLKTSSQKWTPRAWMPLLPSPSAGPTMT